MCIAVFLWKDHPLYPFLLLLNRDEYHHRPTLPLAWWEDEEDPHILGGRDCLAGGTWLACSRNGRLAFLTNVRELPSASECQPKSRGDLPVRFLKGKYNAIFPPLGSFTWLCKTSSLNTTQITRTTSLSIRLLIIFIPYSLITIRFIITPIFVILVT
ncbi:hypothetical protein M9H77_00819 [Catharanthus roseus]|uniref:Uncharacterized protein n=1 Tax=Catharanthus roseus TaxID=4058 RepID=A0ACC0C3X4_CATRO|nr:hypothetical protein M9H77_00819 [Catharanthus roseus]